MASQWNQQTSFVDPVYQFYGNNGAVAARRFVPWPFGTSPSASPVNPNAGSLRTRNWSQILLTTIAALIILVIGLMITSSLIFALSPEAGPDQSTVTVTVLAEWNSWTPWSTCPTTCNGGIRYRTRECLDTDSTMTSTNCEGTAEESDICNIQQCPTWGIWNAYGPCSSTCGNGQETRTRMCDVPDTTEAECDGPIPEETRLCNQAQCPIWGAWGDYGSCSLTCGVGMHIRTRDCSDPDLTGGSCEGQAPSGSRECNDGPCPSPTVASGSLLLARSFTAALSSPSTPEYQQLKMEVEQQITGVLMEEFGNNLQSLEVTGFRINAAGNVVADFSANIHIDTTAPEIDVAAEITTAIEVATSSGNFGSLPVLSVDVAAQSGTSVAVASAITLDREYTDDLADSTSPVYRQLKMDVEEQVSTVLRGTFGEDLQSVEVIRFRFQRSGSVIADADVMIKSNGEPGQDDAVTRVVVDTFQTATTNGGFGPLPVTSVEAQAQKETLKPVILNTPDDIVQSTNANSATATVNWTPPTATDNSGDVTLSSSHESGSEFPIGLTEVTFTAKDSSFNIVTSSFMVKVTDDEAPVISAISNQNVNTDSGSPTATVTWSRPTATDNSGEDVNLTSDHNPGDLFIIGTTTVTYIAADSKGNEATLQFVVTVTDVEPPVFSGVSENLVVSAFTCTGSNNAAVSWTPPKATDNSGIEVTLESTHNPGDTFPIGENQVIYTAVDGNANSATAQFTVTVTVEALMSCNEQLSEADECSLTRRTGEAEEDTESLLQPGEDWNPSAEGDYLLISFSEPAQIFSLLVTTASIRFNVFLHYVDGSGFVPILDNNNNAKEYTGSTHIPLPTSTSSILGVFIDIRSSVDTSIAVAVAVFGCYSPLIQ